MTAPGADREYRVLVIEDDPATREMYRQALNSAGHVVLTAANGVHGLAQLRHAPDLVVLDLSMPILDGRRFLEFFAAVEQRPGVLIVTGERPIRGADFGDASVLTKPFALEAFLAVVASLLQDRAVPA